MYHLSEHKISKLVLVAISNCESPNYAIYIAICIHIVYINEYHYNVNIYNKLDHISWFPCYLIHPRYGMYTNDINLGTLVCFKFQRFIMYLQIKNMKCICLVTENIMYFLVNIKHDMSMLFNLRTWHILV